ncbi:MAG: hypothetical protein M3328_10315, partial [Chloroflexota bacterium]|nr:hypothetical protein [Chloroflexota bacterium]
MPTATNTSTSTSTSTSTPTITPTATQTAIPSNNNLNWDQLYHGANNSTPPTEQVPGQSANFRQGAPNGSVYPTTAVDIYMLTDAGDVT